MFNFSDRVNQQQKKRSPSAKKDCAETRMFYVLVVPSSKEWLEPLLDHSTPFEASG